MACAARELRMGVWLALLGGAAPLANFWVLLSSFLEEYMGPHFWAQPSLVAACGIPYGVFFETGRGGASRWRRRSPWELLRRRGA